jgi:hypothetical protein
MSLLKFSAVATLSFLLLSGCGKKTEEPAPVVEKAASEELFDEFYEETTSDESTVTEADFEEPIEEQATTVAPQFSPDGRYVVQVSCIASEEIAEDVARKFETQGYPVYIAEVKNPTPQLMGTYFRIRIGGFDGLTDAQSFGEDFLLTNGYEYWVDNRSNDNVGIGDYGLGDDAGDFTFEEETSSYGSESTYGEPVVEETSSYESESTYGEPVVEESYTEEVVEPAPVEETYEAPVDTYSEPAATESFDEPVTTEETVATEDEWSTDETTESTSDETSSEWETTDW